MLLTKFTFFLRFLVLVGISPNFNTNAQDIKAEEYFIDPGVVLVDNWEGWGTSLAWWADVLGGYDQSVIDAVTDAFFNKEKLNLNIVRYVIGGTTPPEVVPYCGDYRPGAASESFQDGPGLPFNWTRDSRQRKILQTAKSLGANIFEAFSNSPPQWMTISNCAKGNPGGFLLHSNFLPENAPQFAAYVTEVLEHFHTVENITFSYYSPFNEPMGLYGIGAWWGDFLPFFGLVNTQEGCNMNRNTMTEVLKKLSDALDARGLTQIKITAADETQVNTAIGTQDHFVKEGVAGLIAKVNVHGYWDDGLVPNRRDLLNIKSTSQGHKLWMDEMGWAWSPLDDMKQAFEVTRRIVTDVRRMLPSAWVYWQAMESIGEWGLLGVSYTDPDVTVDDILYYSGYYGMLQFSKYIKQGSKIIFSQDEASVVAWDDAAKNLVIVTIHESLTPSKKRIDLRRFAPLTNGSITILSATRTSPTEQNVVVPETQIYMEVDPKNQHLNLDLPSQSISTVVLSNLDLISESNKNLLTNGDFELKGESNNPWSLRAGGQGSITDDSFPWRGTQSGFLQSKVTILSQTVTLDGVKGQVRRLYLSFWGSCTERGGSVEAYVDEVKVADVKMSELPGYQLYGASFSGMVGSKVKIQVVLGDMGVGGPVYVDDFRLHDAMDLNDYVPIRNAANSLISKYLFCLIAVSVIGTLFE